MSLSSSKTLFIEASTYEDLPKHSKVFNTDMLDYHLWIYLNPEDVRNSYFCGGQEIGPDADNSKIFPDTFIRDSQCWIRVNSGYINQKIGKHTLKLSFINKLTDVSFSLYASYYIQNDNPEKPYVYMQKPEQEVFV